MSLQHKSLDEGRWAQFTFLEQMANIGSEVERALIWKTKQNTLYSQKAFERALELIDLTLAEQSTMPRLKELARVREVIVDYFFGTNEYSTTDVFLRKYFSAFIFTARKHY